jgi:hypothetical protein
MCHVDRAGTQLFADHWLLRQHMFIGCTGSAAISLCSASLSIILVDNARHGYQHVSCVVVLVPQAVQEVCACGG